jgi:hypothetical protein
MISQMSARAVALVGIISILTGGMISAFRHEEIYLICSAAWLKVVANVLQWLGIASWSLGVLLAPVFFVAALCFLAGPLVVSALIMVQPIGRALLRIAAWAYFGLAFALGGALPSFPNSIWERNCLRNSIAEFASCSRGMTPREPGQQVVRATRKRHRRPACDGYLNPSPPNSVIPLIPSKIRKEIFPLALFTLLALICFHETNSRSGNPSGCAPSHGSCRHFHAGA